MNPEKCLRVLADLNQIRQCRVKLNAVRESVQILSESLGLAGNEVRLKILYLLKEESQLCPCDLSDILGMNISAISQHLRKLKDGRIIESKRVGQTIFYSISPNTNALLKPVLGLITADGAGLTLAAISHPAGK